MPSLYDAALAVLADHEERKRTYPGTTEENPNRVKVMGELDAALSAHARREKALKAVLKAVWTASADAYGCAQTLAKALRALEQAEQDP